MTIIEIECPNCGERIRINIAKEALSCSVCDERFDVKEAMAKYIIKLQAIISGTHNSKTDSVHIIDNTDFKKDVIPDTSTAPINAFAKTETTETEGNALIPVDEVKMEGNALIPVDEAEQPQPRGIPVGNAVSSPIEDFKIENGVLKKYIGKDAKVIIPNCVTSIGYEAFMWGANLTSITIPSSVTSIGKSAFFGCKNLTSITIPDSVTSVGERAFIWCEKLTNITIPNSVTSIGKDAFKWCESLTSITIPNSVTSIGEYAFSPCIALERITIDRDNPVYDSRDNCNAIIESKTNKLVAGCKTTVIPNSVTSIGERAFNGCTNLTRITIPNSVTSIGDGAFWNCKNLASITIPNSVTSIGDWAFNGCSNLTSIKVPEKLDISHCSIPSECKVKRYRW